MLNLNDISFIQKGAAAEQEFQELVDNYLAGQESINKTLEDGTEIIIRKQDLGDRGPARYITLYNDTIGYEFVLYPTANIDPDTKMTGLKFFIRRLNLPEAMFTLDSGDLETLKQFLAESL